MSAGERSAIAIAHPNIALSKYWGKREGEGNFPAVPSLSVTLRGLATRTRVAFRSDLRADTLTLNGEEASGEVLARATALLDRVRAVSSEHACAEVTSRNDFPTAAGLASSASGFAALAVAAMRAARMRDDAVRASDLARQSSASAARSVFGGFVELPFGEASARSLATPEQIDLRVLVCVATEAKKSIASTRGMTTTAQESPYYAAWIENAPRMHAEIRRALLAKDFEAMGTWAERSALAMHASAIAANVVYWSGVTIDALAAVRELRARGTLAYATIDAGPHVKVLVRIEDAALVGTWMRAVPGVLRVIEARPGPGARIVGSLDPHDDEHDADARRSDA